WMSQPPPISSTIEATAAIGRSHGAARRRIFETGDWSRINARNRRSPQEPSRPPLSRCLDKTVHAGAHLCRVEDGRPPDSLSHAIIAPARLLNPPVVC